MGHGCMGGIIAGASGIVGSDEYGVARFVVWWVSPTFTGASKPFSI